MSFYRIAHVVLYIALCIKHCSALDITLRPATLADLPLIRSALWQEKMNPLSIESDNLLVACNPPNKLLGFGQVRPLTTNYAEMASLYVYPDYRKQGIGSRLVEALCNRHDKTTPDSRIVLLTLQSTMPFYSQFGFYKTNTLKLPAQIQAESLLGNLVTSILGKDPVVCMIRDKQRLP
jgi:N-acetylglutamate synthase-like GNAT family acetyltransferase